MPIPFRPNRCLAALAAALLVSLPATAQKPAAPPPKFDDYVAGVLKTFTVPGVAVAIVKDGKVVLAKGYGVRRLGDPTPVDARTQFGIASNTKLFTATALALLVEEGKVEWDAPVIRYLPWFAMYDPYVTRELTVRDLLVHRSGLGLGAGRPAVVAAVDLRPEGDRPAAPLHPAGDVVPERVRLRQRALPRGGRGHRGGVRTDLGGLRAAPASWPRSG